jgi:hypothetical protein
LGAKLFNLALKTLDLLDRISGGHEFVGALIWLNRRPGTANGRANGTFGWAAARVKTDIERDVRSLYVGWQLSRLHIAEQNGTITVME